MSEKVSRPPGGEPCADGWCLTAAETRDFLARLHESDLAQASLHRAAAEKAERERPPQPTTNDRGELLWVDEMGFLAKDEVTGEYVTQAEHNAEEKKRAAAWVKQTEGMPEFEELRALVPDRAAQRAQAIERKAELDEAHFEYVRTHPDVVRKLRPDLFHHRPASWASRPHVARLHRPAASQRRLRCVRRSHRRAVGTSGRDGPSSSSDGDEPPPGDAWSRRSGRVVADSDNGPVFSVVDHIPVPSWVRLWVFHHLPNRLQRLAWTQLLERLDRKRARGVGLCQVAER